jgi:hypothetical protein
MMAVPTVSCDALLALKALLGTVDVVLQAQHRPVLAAGGADATVSQSTATLATHPVPSAPPASIASGVPVRVHVSRVVVGDDEGREVRDE